MKKFKISSSFTEINEHAKKIGYAVCLMNRTPNYALYHLVAVKLWIEQAILHDQIMFFFSPYEIPIGYITWATLSDSMASQFEKGEFPLLHPSEWNEGDNLWILDFCFPQGFDFEIKSFLKEKFAVDFSTVSWVDRGKKLRPRKYRRFLL